MAKFRKKPVEIEAFKFDGDFMDSKGRYYVPDWAVKAYQEGVLYFEGPGRNRRGFYVGVLID